MSKSLLIALAAWLCRFHFNLSADESKNQRHGLRETHLLIIENEPQLPNELSVVAVIFKGDKAESFGPARLAVHHNRGVNDLSIFGKEGTH